MKPVSLDQDVFSFMFLGFGAALGRDLARLLARIGLALALLAALGAARALARPMLMVAGLRDSAGHPMGRTAVVVQLGDVTAAGVSDERGLLEIEIELHMDDARARAGAGDQGVLFHAEAGACGMLGRALMGRAVGSLLAVPEVRLEEVRDCPYEDGVEEEEEEEEEEAVVVMGMHTRAVAAMLLATGTVMAALVGRPRQLVHARHPGRQRQRPEQARPGTPSPRLPGTRRRHWNDPAAGLVAFQRSLLGSHGGGGVDAAILLLVDGRYNRCLLTESSALTGA